MNVPSLTLKAIVDAFWDRLWRVGISECNTGQRPILRTVPNVFIRKRKMEEADLYEVPFANFGSYAVEKYFTQDKTEELMELTKKLAA